MQEKQEEENKINFKKQNSKDIKFSVVFKKDGDSFQNVMEKILLSKMINN